MRAGRRVEISRRLVGEEDRRLRHPAGLAGAGVGFTMCSVAVMSALVLFHQGRPVSVRAAIENLGAGAR